MRCAIYARVSTLDQHVENQLQELRSYVERRVTQRPFFHLTRNARCSARLTNFRMRVLATAALLVASVDVIRLSTHPRAAKTPVRQ